MYIRWQEGVTDYFGTVYYREGRELVIGYAENDYQPGPFVLPLENLNKRYQEITIEKYYDLLHQHVILMIKEICRQEGQK